MVRARNRFGYVWIEFFSIVNPEVRGLDPKACILGFAAPLITEIICQPLFSRKNKSVVTGVLRHVDSDVDVLTGSALKIRTDPRCDFTWKASGQTLLGCVKGT